MGKWLLKAPYIQLSRHGIFRYRRVIPLELRPAAGKREILVSLRTKEASLAQSRFVEAHEAAEAWLRSLVGVSAQPQTTPRLGSEHVPLKAIGTFALPSIHISSGGELSAVAPTSQSSFKLSDALALYLDEKRSEFEAYSGRELKVRLNEKHRVIRYLVEALDADREIASLTRQDARTFRESLRRRGLSGASIDKNFKIAAAVIELSLIERQLGTRNPLHRFRIASEVRPQDARLPLIPGELATVRRLPVNEELACITELLISTGARLNEIAGLDWNDVMHARGTNPFSYIHIRSNHIRRLKTDSSNRCVPLTHRATNALSEISRGRRANTASGPIFPRYGRSGGADAASAALMKALRKAGITDKRKSIHSIRHSVKQALRDVGCPKDIRDAIQGHSANDVAENYGLGHSLETMSRWLERAAERLEI